MASKRRNRFQLYIADDQLENFDKLLKELQKQGKSLAGELRQPIEELINEHVRGKYE